MQSSGVPRPLPLSLLHFRPLFSLLSSTLPKTLLLTHRYTYTFPFPDTDPLQYLTTTNTLTKTLLQNPRNFTALNTLDSLLTHSPIINSATSVFVIDRLSKLKKLGRAKTVICAMRERGKASDCFLFSMILDFMIKDGSFSDAMIVWDDICGGNLKIDVSDYVLYVCKYGEAFDIKRVCERVFLGYGVLRKESYEALIEALSIIDKSVLAKKVVQVMDDKGVEIDDKIYFEIFGCFCRNGDLDEADLVLKKLVRRNSPIGMCFCRDFLYALCKRGRIREAHKLFRKMVANVCSITSKNEILKEGKRVIFQLNFANVVSEMVAYEIYFKSLCSIGRLDEAEILLKKMMKKRYVFKTCVYGSFMEALFKAGREEDAMKFFNLEKKKGIVGGDEIAKFVVIGLCEKGRVDDALKIFKENITSDGIVNHGDICNNILIGYWKLKRVEEAEKFFDQLRNNYFGVNLFTYKTMINNYCKEASFEKALCLFEEMPKQSIVVDKALYEIIIRSLCSHGRFKDAFIYLNDMIENGVCVSCSSTITFFDSMFNRDK